MISVSMLIKKVHKKGYNYKLFPCYMIKFPYPLCS